MGVNGGGRILCRRVLGGLSCGGRGGGAELGGGGSLDGVPVSCWTMLRKSFLLMLYTCGCGCCGGASGGGCGCGGRGLLAKLGWWSGLFRMFFPNLLTPRCCWWLW